MGLPLEKLTLEAFLEWEHAQDTRNEFYRGDVFAMAGARRARWHRAAVTRRVFGRPVMYLSSSGKPR